jgi:deoxyhypusine synthase
LPYRAPGSSGHSRQKSLSGKPITYYRPRGSEEIRHLIDNGFQAFNAGRLSEACRIFAEKMLAPEHDTTIGLTIAGAMTPAGLGGCVIEMMDRGLVDFVISTGANLYHDLHYAMNFTLHRGSPFANDLELYEDGVIRIYDVLFPATVLLETDAYIRDFIVRSGRRPNSTIGSDAICSRSIPAARSTPSWRAPPWPACRCIPRRPATARSA